MDEKEKKQRKKKEKASKCGYVVKTKNSEAVCSKPDSNINPRQINHTHTHTSDFQ